MSVGMQFRGGNVLQWYSGGGASSRPAIASPPPGSSRPSGGDTDAGRQTALIQGALQRVAVRRQTWSAVRTWLTAAWPTLVLVVPRDPEGHIVIGNQLLRVVLTHDLTGRRIQPPI